MDLLILAGLSFFLLSYFQEQHEWYWLGLCNSKALPRITKLTCLCFMWPLILQELAQGCSYDRVKVLRARESAKDSLRPALGTGTVSLLLYPTNQSKSLSPLRFKGKGK